MALTPIGREGGIVFAVSSLRSALGKKMNAHRLEEAAGLGRREDEAGREDQGGEGRMEAEAKAAAAAKAEAQAEAEDACAAAFPFGFR